MEAGSRLPSPLSPAALSRRLVFNSISLICICFAYRDSSPSAQDDGGRREGEHITQAPSSGGNPAWDCQVGQSWPDLEQQWSNIVILNLVHPMAPQGATRIKRGAFLLFARPEWSWSKPGGTPNHFSERPDAVPPSPTATPAGRALRCSLYVQAMLT